MFAVWESSSKTMATSPVRSILRTRAALSADSERSVPWRVTNSSMSAARVSGARRSGGICNIRRLFGGLFLRGGDFHIFGVVLGQLGGGGEGVGGAGFAE